MDTKKLRQKILDLAIHGKLVPQDPNDEPASVLLERIRAEKERLIKEGKIKKSKASKTADKPHYENVPFEVPNGWECVYLDEIAFIGTGSTPSKSNKGYYGGNIPWISSSATNLPVITKATDYITEKALKETNCQLYPKGTLIMAMYGEGKTRGQVSELDFECCTNQACAAILPFLRETGKYIKLYLESQYYHLRALAEGGNQPNLNLTKISSYIIPYPPYAEQSRILKTVEHWFALIDKIEQGKANLQAVIKQTKSKILDLAIHGKLVAQDPNDEPATELLKRINPKTEITCDNGQYQNLPNGWAICKLSDLCKIENGYAFSSNNYKTEGIPLVRISNITNSTIDLFDCVFIQDTTIDDKFKISKGDLLIAMSGATTGKMGVYPYEDVAYLNQRVGNIKILNKSSLFPLYRDFYMQSKVEEILKLAYGGAQPNISASVIGNFEFLLPPLEEQKRIVNAIEKAFAKLDTIMESL